MQEMYERKVTAGEILIKEGDTGAAASELFVVKSGEFEVRLPDKLCRQGPQMVLTCPCTPPPKSM